MYDVEGGPVAWAAGDATDAAGDADVVAAAAE